MTKVTVNKKQITMTVEREEENEFDPYDAMVDQLAIDSFKSLDKYINSRETAFTNIKIYFMWKGSTIITCHLVVNA